MTAHESAIREAKPQSGNLLAQSGNPTPLSGKPPAQSVNLGPQSVNLLHRFIRRLCHWRAMSTEDLAALLQRNRNCVTNRLVTPMLKAGRLEMTIPEQPNHPQQQYRATVPPEERA